MDGLLTLSLLHDQDLNHLLNPVSSELSQLVDKADSTGVQPRHPLYPSPGTRAEADGQLAERYRVSIEMVCEAPQLQAVIGGLAAAGKCINIRIDRDS